MWKRFLSLMLALVAVFSLPAGAFASQGTGNGALPTEEEVYARLIAVQETYPEGTPWDSSSYYIDKYGYAEYGCFGFATLLQEAAFPGMTLQRTKRPPITIEDLHVGDLLSYGIGGGQAGHSVVVLEVHSDYIVLAEGNWADCVHWGRTMTADEVASVQYCYTYYPDKPQTIDPPGKTGWTEENGERYYYKNDKLVTGWDWIDSAWYYFDPSGKLVHDQWAKDSKYLYYMGHDGKMLTGFHEIGAGNWYYFNPKNDGSYGRVMTGWTQIDGTWYYFNKQDDGHYGRMYVNDWAMDGPYWFFLDSDGKMMAGLREIAIGNSYDGLYYFNEKHDGYYGRVMAGWQKVNGAWYYFNKEHNGQYGIAYVNGWYEIGGKYYYFYADGKMAADTIVNGWRVNKDGVRIGRA